MAPPPPVAPPPGNGGNNNNNNNRNNNGDEFEILLVIGDVDNPAQGDEDLQEIIEDLLNGDDEIEVDTADDEDDAEDTDEDFDAVIISSSVNANVIQNEYENEQLPIMVMDAATLAEMEMTGDQNNQDFGNQNATEIEILEENHPIIEAINAEEDDEVEVAQNNISMTFGEPGNDAEDLAQIVNQNGRSVLFEYEAGSDLENDTEAEDDRIGFFLNEQDVNDLNGDGEDLLEATLLYVITGDAED